MRLRVFAIILTCFLPLSALADTAEGIKIRHANSKNKAKTVRAPEHPVRAGSKALAFVVANGQCAGNRNYNDCKGQRERSEISDEKAIKTEREQWYAFSVMVPKGTPHIDPSGTILAQFQDSKGSGEITLGFEMWREGLILVQDDPRTQQSDDRAPPKPMVIKTVIPNSRLRGRWHDFRVRAVWSAKDSGVIQVWLGDKLVHQHQGRNLNRNVAPKFKFGLYRTGLDKYRARVNPTVPTQVIYFDEVRRGPSAASVAIP
ncbi:hypothetical protein AIOL_001962 [Candidatus Rhodobacter oscarellae]|uniref:Polysaccharide lyase-like protein n=1 Tax=Candidatus Rhodobacter oscarellae TaxID=1675527 RepID=A0A0J9E595_9RHOB|nr:polysaccharide lyase [Candidatus Rhodobacter lobularis]KMW57004.1 hypothetical protein AIOL_001962 [Candidatus Rhodobacter lobularis]